MRNVVFSGIDVRGVDIPSIDIKGCDTEHMIENVRFLGLTVNGKTIASTADSLVRTNEYVRGVAFGER